MRFRALGAGLAGVLLLAGAACPSYADPAPVEPAWGVVDSACAPDRLAAQRGAGLSVAVVDAHWDRLQPRPGAFEPAAAAGLAARVTRCLDAGMRVVLGSGAQYPPSWVRDLPDALLRDQHGGVARTGGVDLVFAAAPRAALDDYLTRLVAAVPATRLTGVRVGTSAAGEIGYPGPHESGYGVTSWWAFGAPAQTGRDLAPGQQPSPLPGWAPGSAQWEGRAVTAVDAGRWFGWYSGALVEALAAQARVLRGAGFAGEVHLPVPGRGVLPADRSVAVGSLLDGHGDRDGSLHRGLDHVAAMPGIAAAVPGPVVVDLTSVDDATAVRARALDPPEDTCRPEDPAVALDPTVRVERWSNLRFARAQAARAGLPVVGENPGPPGETTGGAADSDQEAEQVRRAPGYARNCGLAAFTLAFEEDLHTPRSGVTLADYVAAMLRT
ncbi:beta-galactosidase-like protein [Actinomycetospora succinea]|uniref:Beta-galactosidase-like protein n=1 Tax=Actinomycetospora succinea TaxID=663603 RepID=A0A4R6URV1_9PSEU|nr:beta-galactosidase [Actinomycetospora succinea]TDQ48956.1 beta-galactosidase-like protein [Actinomycetospora succinea]